MDIFPLLVVHLTPELSKLSSCIYLKWVLFLNIFPMIDLLNFKHLPFSFSSYEVCSFFSSSFTRLYKREENRLHIMFLNFSFVSLNSSLINNNVFLLPSLHLLEELNYWDSINHLSSWTIVGLKCHLKFINSTLASRFLCEQEH